MRELIGRLLNGHFTPPPAADWHDMRLFETVDARIEEVNKIKLRWYFNGSSIKASWRNLWIARKPLPAVDVWYEEREPCKFYVRDTGEKVSDYMNRLLSIERLFAACADETGGIPLMPVSRS